MEGYGTRPFLTVEKNQQTKATTTRDSGKAVINSYQQEKTFSSLNNNLLAVGEFFATQ